MIVFAMPYLRVNRWRADWPADELHHRGYPVCIIGRPDAVKYSRRWVGGHDFSPGDTVILHATNQDVGLSGTVRYFRSIKVVTAVQLDDDYTALGDLQELGPWYADLMRDLQIGCMEADHVIASTPAVLRAYDRWIGGMGWIVRNWLPARLTEPTMIGTMTRFPRADPPMAGWFGTLDAHVRDVAMLAQAPKPARFGVVGAWEDFEKVSGWMLDWHRPVALGDAELYRKLSAFTVGVAPVKDDAFNRAKSWIKPLEFAAAGVPCVASDVEPYRDLLVDGFDVTTASDPEDMAKSVRWFLDYNDFAREVGLKAQQSVRDRYTLEARGGDEWQAFAEAVV